MSDALYPSLPGLKFGVSRVPVFKTTVDETASGREYTAAMMVYPRIKYTLSYEFLRDRSALDEMRTLVGFFEQRRGRYDTFLFDDPDDNSATAQTFGVGDGSTVAFQLVRSFGGSVTPIYDPVLAGINVFAAGALVVPTSIVKGLVTFPAPPANGAALTWTGSFRHRVRFLQDELDAEKFMHRLWSVGKVEFITVKP